jgi:3',5'-cyclic AMP phosphodiesterase CpdA
MPKKYRLHISLIILIALVILSFAGYNRVSGKSNDSATAEKPSEIVLTWTDDPCTTQTISWKASSAVKDGYVRYRVADSGNADQIKEAVVQRFPFVQGATHAAVNCFTATLTGLKQNTRYEYTVHAGNSSLPNQFTTGAQNPESYTFLVFGDSQSGNPLRKNYEPWRIILNQGFSQYPDSRFIVCTGDLVETGQNYDHWESWFDAVKGTLEKITFIPVPGNHETYSGLVSGGRSRPVYFLAQFPVFSNGPDNMKGEVYSFDYGQAHLVILDSQQREMGSGEFLKTQAEWLAKDLAATKKTWKIVFFHKPYFYHHDDRKNIEVRAAFSPVLDRYHADIVFNGHEHILARTYPYREGVKQADTKSGTIYYTVGRSGAKSYKEYTAREWDAFFYNPADQPCYVSVQVEPSRMIITARKQDGSQLDSYTISK